MGAKAQGVCASGSVGGGYWLLAARARGNFGACVEAILPFGTERAERGTIITAITRDEPKPRVPLLSGRAARKWRRIGRRRIAFCALRASARLCAKKNRPGNTNSHFQLAKAYSSYRYQTGIRVAGRLDARSHAEISCSSTKLGGFVLKNLPTQNKTNSAATSRDACG